MKVCIFGMGYVGITLAAALAEKGIDVTGIDPQETIISKLQAGESHVEEPGLEELIKKHIGTRIHVYQAPPNERFDIIIVSVGTPTDKDGNPIMKYVEEVSKTISSLLQGGEVIILRSTVPVGTTRNLVLPILEESKKEFSLVFAPERTVEGKAVQELYDLPQVIAGLDETSTKKAVKLFEQLTDDIVIVDSLEAAEMVKLVNNVYRDVNIALGNEFGLLCERLGLDADQVIGAANHNYGRAKVMKPGAGVGGICLQKDSQILTRIAKEHDSDLPLIKTARKLNEAMPAHVFDLIKDAYSEANLQLKASKVLVMGIAFKGQPETNDVRNSPALEVISLLKKEGAEVSGYDPVLGETIKDHELEPVDLSQPHDFDCVAILNNHASFKDFTFDKIQPKIVVDGWHMLSKRPANTVYRCLGVGVKTAKTK